MNEDAEKWIVDWYTNSGAGPQSVADVIREAMRWAYADAAKVCHDRFPYALQDHPTLDRNAKEWGYAANQIKIAIEDRGE